MVRSGLLLNKRIAPNKPSDYGRLEGLEGSVNELRVVLGLRNLQMLPRSVLKQPNQSLPPPDLLAQEGVKIEQLVKNPRFARMWAVLLQCKHKTTVLIYDPHPTCLAHCVCYSSMLCSVIPIATFSLCFCV